MRIKRKAFTGIFLSCLAAGMTVTAESTEDRITKLEQEVTALKNSGGGGGAAFPSWFSLGGEWEVEYVDMQGGFHSPADSHAKFQHDKFLLKPGIKLSKNLKIKGELSYATGGANLEEYQAYFTGLPGGVWFKVGLDERFINSNGKFDMANRKTEDYPLLGSAFWRDEQLGITFGGKHEMGSQASLFWNMYFGNGLELNEKQPTEIDAYEIIHDNDLASDTVNKKNEWAYGLGVNFKVSDNYKFDVMGFLIESELNRDEEIFLGRIPSYATLDIGHGSNTAANPNQIGNQQRRWGGRTTHKMGGTTFTYEHIRAQDAKLRRKGWYAQLSHHIKCDPLIADEFIVGFEPLYRYEELDTNLPRSFAGNGPSSWDREKRVYALLVDLTKNDHLKSKLKLEYYENGENTGAITGRINEHSRVRNDEFLAQLEFKF